MGHGRRRHRGGGPDGGPRRAQGEGGRAVAGAPESTALVENNCPLRHRRARPETMVPELFRPEDHRGSATPTPKGELVARRCVLYYAQDRFAPKFMIDLANNADRPPSLSGSAMNMPACSATVTTSWRNGCSPPARRPVATMCGACALAPLGQRYDKNPGNRRSPTCRISAAARPTTLHHPPRRFPGNAS